MIINHQEALEYAYLHKEDSNLARCYIELAEGQKPPTNNAMDAIAALKDLVSAIDTYNSNPEYMHAPWVRESKELSHARSVLQQHQ